MFNLKFLIMEGMPIPNDNVVHSFQYYNFNVIVCKSWRDEFYCIANLDRYFISTCRGFDMDNKIQSIKDQIEMFIGYHEL